MDWDWLFSAPIEHLTVRDDRVIDALLFTLEGDCIPQLIAWPDEYGCGGYARPKRRSDTLLDLRAFQEIVWSGGRRDQELVVTQVQLYRCNRPHENGRVVDCGQAWLNEGAGHDPRD